MKKRRWKAWKNKKKTVIMSNVLEGFVESANILINVCPQPIFGINVAIHSSFVFVLRFRYDNLGSSFSTGSSSHVLRGESERVLKAQQVSVSQANVDASSPEKSSDFRESIDFAIARAH